MMTAMSGTNLAVTAAEKDGRPGMRRLLSPLALALAFGAATAASAQSPGKLNVSVAGVRNDNGSVRCGLYSSANGFREPGREMRGAVPPIKNGQATCVFNGVPAELRDRGIPRRAQRDADGDRPVPASPSRATVSPTTPSSTFRPRLQRRLHLRRDTPDAGAPELQDCST
jgi:uncharacterized protein (DUF2141 family)